MNSVQLLALAMLLLLLGAAVWFARRAAGAATPIDPEDPLWQAALARARATAADMRALHEQGHEVWVKFACTPAGGEQEHFWGRIAGMQDDVLTVAVETRPVQGGAVPRELPVALRDVEDWQVELPDGSIRGGFSTRAQVEIAQREGETVPRHIREMIGRMKDV